MNNVSVIKIGGSTLGKHDTTGLSLEVVHASEAVTMTDKPDVVKSKPDSSMHVGMKLVEEGQAEAFVSAGNKVTRSVCRK